MKAVYASDFRNVFIQGLACGDGSTSGAAKDDLPEISLQMCCVSLF